MSNLCLSACRNYKCVFWVSQTVKLYFKLWKKVRRIHANIAYIMDINAFKSRSVFSVIYQLLLRILGRFGLSSISI